MSYNFDDINVGGQVKVGTGIVPAIKEGDEKINGSMYAEGPVVFGNQTTFKNQDGTLMVARNTNNDKDCEVPDDDKALFVRGDVRFETEGENDHGLHVEGDTKIVGDGRADNTLLIESAGQTDAVKITGGGTIQLRDDGDAIFSVGTGGSLLSSRFSAADADQNHSISNIPREMDIVCAMHVLRDPRSLSIIEVALRTKRLSFFQVTGKILYMKIVYLCSCNQSVLTKMLSSRGGIVRRFIFSREVECRLIASSMFMLREMILIR